MIFLAVRRATRIYNPRAVQFDSRKLLEMRGMSLLVKATGNQPPTMLKVELRFSFDQALKCSDHLIGPVGLRQEIFDSGPVDF